MTISLQSAALHRMGAYFCRSVGQADDGDAIVRFLRVLPAQNPRESVDYLGWCSHSSEQSLESLFGHARAAKRIRLEQLPSYAPDLNPDEGIWQYLKRYELGNCVLCFHRPLGTRTHSGT